MARKTREIALEVPTVTDGEVTKYRLIEQTSGDICGYVTRRVDRTENGQGACYSVSTQTESVDGKVSEETTILGVTEVLKPLSSQWIAKSNSGKVLMDARMIYDNGTSEFPLNSHPMTAAEFSLRGGPFILNARIPINVLVLGGQSFKWHIETSKEKVIVPAGTFECYKVKYIMDTDSILSQMPGVKMPPGFGTFAQHLMPTFCRWYSQEEPHYSVKFEGFYPPPCPVNELVFEELVSVGEE